jgi:hypothetical protein
VGQEAGHCAPPWASPATCAGLLCPPLYPVFCLAVRSPVWPMNRCPSHLWSDLTPPTPPHAPFHSFIQHNVQGGVQGIQLGVCFLGAPSFTLEERLVIRQNAVFW